MRLSDKIIILAMILMGVNVTDNYAADALKEYWTKPTLFKWERNNISIGGISPKEISCLFIWSVTKEEMVWYMSLKDSRYESYTKESRTEKTSFKYKTVPSDWRQWVPYSEEPREIEHDEIICLYFKYTMDWLFGPRKEQVEIYLKKTANGFENIEIEIGSNEYKEIYETMFKFIKMRSLPPFGPILEAEEIQKGLGVKP